MQVILLDKVANPGGPGDQVNVKAGYARNFRSAGQSCAGNQEKR